MYDQYARQLIDSLPELPDIDRTACRRALSSAYFHVVRSRLAADQDRILDTDLSETQTLLRSMADALESVAVFDRLHGQELSEDTERACAFVAAESLSLLAMLSRPGEIAPDRDLLLQEPNYASIEAALLYMIGGYDINATSIIRNVVIPDIRTEDAEPMATVRQTNSSHVLHRVSQLCRGDVRRPRSGNNPIQFDNNGNVTGYTALMDEVSARFYAEIGSALDNYLDWLGGYEETGLNQAVSILESVRTTSVTTRYPGYTGFAEIYHLCSLLLATIDRTSNRSLIHKIPSPSGGNEQFLQAFSSYIQGRARGGEETKGRPLLWPSAIRYVEECLPGPHTSAVISMPTGSGKSFIAELATAHALDSGWVLYIAPTNALTHQIRRNLTHAFQSLGQITIRSFIGRDEYTSLTGEQITLLESNFVAVMTPEKCALALRLYPEQFENCALCVFDECHLLGDQQRGTTADILIAQLATISPSMRFVLMSAMVSNPNELADWLTNIHESTSAPLRLEWRPSRTMRGLLVVDQDELDNNFEDAKIALTQLPEHRVNQKFKTPLALIAGLSGPWTMQGPLDYRIAKLPVFFDAIASKRSSTPVFDSWKNTSSGLLSEVFARSGIPTICFLLSSRHHVFSSADKVQEKIPGSLETGKPFPEIVEAWLQIADAELGVPTALRDLLRQGIAVHSSSLLPPEHAASEWMFVQRKTPLMFATATLAQGLNLPAIAVVIAGTSMGDPRTADTHTAAGISRVNSLILNGFGRAGRPGFSNQGIAVLVSNEPYSARIVSDLDPSGALVTYPVLGEPDAAVYVRSPIEAFLDNLLVAHINVDEFSQNELILASLMAEYDADGQNAGQILSRTLAAYHKRQIFSLDTPSEIQARIFAIKESLFQQPDIPEWINSVAMKAGVTFARAWRMWAAYQQRGLVPNEEETNLDVLDWLTVFFETMALMPPKQITGYLPSDELRTETILTRLRDSISDMEGVDTVPWATPPAWTNLWRELMTLVAMYMQGESYAAIAQVYLGLSSDEITNRRSSGAHPIPAVLKFLRDVVDKLAIDAGCFLAIHEYIAHEREQEPIVLPETLEALPLCIRNGCDSLGSLAWYRSGYRQRICAHALEEAFPVPTEFTTDEERMLWVIQTRRQWLLGTLIAENQPLLPYAKTALLES